MLPTKFQFIWPNGFRGEESKKNQTIRNKNRLWRPCLLTNRDGMSNLYRGPSIDAPTKFQIIWPSGFRGEDFKKSTDQKKELPVAPCLSMDRDEMSTLYRGPPIDASCQVSVHLAERFQRRRLKCEKLTDDGRQVMAKAHLAFGKTT